MKLSVICLIASISCNAAELRLSIDGGLVLRAQTEFVVESAVRPDALTIDEVIFDGSSLTSGGSWIPKEMIYPAQLMAMLPGVRWTNVAVSGQTGGAMLADFDTQIKPMLSPEKCQAVVFDMGTNDLLVEGASVQVVKDRYALYVSKCVAAGVSSNLIFIRPLSQRLTLGNFSEENRVEINSWLLATFPQSVIDPATEPRIYGPGAMRKYEGVYFADVTHPNAAGATLEASAFYAHISRSIWVYAGESSGGQWRDTNSSGLKFFRAVQ